MSHASCLAALPRDTENVFISSIFVVAHSVGLTVYYIRLVLTRSLLEAGQNKDVFLTWTAVYQTEPILASLH